MMKDHFGSELQRVRDETGLSRTAFGAKAGFHPETIRSYEKGRRTPTAELAQKADEILEAKGLFAGLQKLAEADTSPFGELKESEQRATSIRIWDPIKIPGLLQTERTASALLNDPAQVAGRMERQGIFQRDDPPHLHVIISESVLYNEIGGPAVLREQLLHLIRPDAPWTLQVMADQSGSSTGVDGPLILLEFPGDEPPIAYLDSRHGGTVVDDHGGVDEYWREWERLTSEAQPPSMSYEIIADIAAELPED